MLIDLLNDLESSRELDARLNALSRARELPSRRAPWSRCAPASRGGRVPSMTAKKAPPPKGAAKRTARAKKGVKPAPERPLRYTFERVAESIPVADLTPLRRAQLAIAIELGVGRRTAPERLPKHYFDIPLYTELWRVLEGGVHRFDFLLNTVFFADSAEPVGIERIQGSFDATGRDAKRGLELDLPRLAWELHRSWPGRKLPPPAEPPDSTGFAPAGPGLRDLEWPPDTAFV